jgi:uncharacterized protein
MSPAQPPGSLPSYVDAPKWADREAVIDQVFPLSTFPRLQEVVVDGAGEASASGINIRCRFYRNQQHFVVLEGRMAARLPLQCQRCLEAVATDIESEFTLFLLRDEESAERLADDADYLLLDEEGRLLLVDALEDELLLALPLVPLHDDCEALDVAGVEYGGDGDEADQASPESADVGAVKPTKKENPFQVLAGLKIEPDSSKKK